MKTVVVTGAASGIGAACAKHFLAAGWNVVLNYFGPSMLPLAEGIAATAAPGTALFVDGDVTRDSDCRAIAAAAIKAFGRIDALINCAGNTRIVAHADLDGLSLDDFLGLCAVNTAGPFLMSRACAPHLAATGDGVIVNISSIAGLYGGGSSIAYAASKGALNTLTLSLARVLGPKIRVNAVCPALVEHGFLQRLDPAAFEPLRARQIERSPLQRVGQPEDIAQSVFGIVTSMPLTTGEIMLLDAGIHLRAEGFAK